MTTFLLVLCFLCGPLGLVLFVLSDKYGTDYGRPYMPLYIPAWVLFIIFAVGYSFAMGALQ